MYSFNSRVRFSEVDASQHLTLRAILDYFQDCSIFHSEAVGVSIDYLAEQGYAWLLSSWQIIIDSYPMLGEELTISTWAYGFKNFYGYRNFTLKDSKGTTVAYANSTWIFVDIKNGTPAKLPQKVQTGYGFDPQLEMDNAPRKIKLPKELTAMPTQEVHKFQIDTNQHVNNAMYVLMAEEFLPDNDPIRQLRVDYRKAAVLGDTLYPAISDTPGCFTVALNNADGEPYAIIEFTRR